jgi:hypothetical protein
MSVASRTPSFIGIITRRSTMAMDCSSFSRSNRRCWSAGDIVACCAGNTASTVSSKAVSVKV